MRPFRWDVQIFLSENLVVVKELLKSGYRKVDARTPEGLTALHLSCLSNSEEIVQELLGAGARVKVRDKEGLSPLHVSLGSIVSKSLPCPTWFEHKSFAILFKQKIFHKKCQKVDEIYVLFIIIHKFKWRHITAWAS